MRSEFSLALVKGGDLQEIREALHEQARTECKRKIAKIDRDFNHCQLVRAALSEPSDTPQFQIAEAYLNMYRKQHEPVLKAERQVYDELMSFNPASKADLTIDEP